MVRPWNSSYRFLSPLRISTAPSTSGSSTETGWNLRSSAASFSMWRRYSFRVVAPMIRKLPLASTGFKIFAASSASLAPAPAPMIVCSSSRNRITSSFFSASSKNFWIRSSKSPLNLVPDIIPTRSTETIRLCLRFIGICPSAIR